MDWTGPNRAGFMRRNAEIIQAVERLEDAVSEDPVQVTLNGGVQTMWAIWAHLAAHPLAPHLEVRLTATLPPSEPARSCANAYSRPGV